MTLDDLEKAKGAADRRLELCVEVRLIKDNFIHQGQMLTLTGRMPEPRLFGLELDDDAVAALRAALIGDRERRIANTERVLRSLGFTIPLEIAPEKRPPASWDPVSGTFDFTIGSAAPVLAQRRLGVSGTIWVQESINPRGQMESLGPVLVEAHARLHPTVGEVIRTRLEGNTIIGTATVSPLASGLRAALDAGQVRLGHVEIEILEETVEDRRWNHPLVTVTAWRLRKIRLDPDGDVNIGRMDPAPVKVADEAA